MRANIRLAILLSALFLTPGLAWANRTEGKASPPSKELSSGDVSLPADSLNVDWVQALLKRGDAPRAEAAARAIAGQVEGSAPVDSLLLARALDLTLEAATRQGKFQDPELIEIGLRVIALREAVLGPDDKLVGDALYSLGRVEVSQSRHTDADAHFRRCLAIRERIDGPESDAAASVKVALARVAMRMGDNLRARELLVSALPIREKTHGPDAPPVAFAHRYLGDACFFIGDFDCAEEHYSASVAALERAFGPDHFEVATTLLGYGALQLTVGDFGGAEGSFVRAIAILESLYGPDHLDIAPVLHNLSQLYWITGDLKRARAAAERAIAIADAGLGAESTLPGKFRSGLGDVALAEGEYAEARRLYREALDLTERAAGPEHPDVGEALRLQAALLSGIGDYEEARAMAERALGIYEKAEGSTGPTVAMVLDQLGVLAHQRGEMSRAQEYLERAMAICEGNESQDLSSAPILEHLAALEEETGRSARARELLLRALEMQETIYGASSSWVAEALLPLGRLDLAAGNPADAVDRFQRALQISLEAYGEEHPKVAEAVAALAEAQLAQGHLAPATEGGLRAEAIARRHFVLTAHTLPERPVLEYAKTRPHGLDLALSALTVQLESGDGEAPANANEIFDAVVKGRALVFDEIAARQRTRTEQDDPETARLRSEWQSTRTAYAQLLVRAEDTDDPELSAKARLEARRRMEAAEEALAMRAASHGVEVGGDSSSGRGVELKGDTSSGSGVELEGDIPSSSGALATDIASRLDEGTALVSFVLYDRHRPVKRAHFAAVEPSYLAFVLTARALEPTVHFIGPASEVDALVTRWRQEVLRHDSEDAYRSAGAELRARVWDRLWSSGSQEEISIAVIVPDGALHLVDWNALPSGEDRYLIETGLTIQCLGAERDLLALDSSDEGESGALLALGGAAYDSIGWNPESGRGDAPDDGDVASTAEDRAMFRGPREECFDLASTHFDDLPGTRTEAQEVAALWAGPSKQLLGTRASETAFKSLAGGQSALHLATHGFSLGGTCVDVGGLRGVGGLGRPVAIKTERLANPLRLCGLALAGANLRRGVGESEDDGILTAEEIATLDLRGVELVTLSACETGLGEVQRGEGVLGLRRAFQVAGARTVVTSLWPIADEHGLDWSRKFYAAIEAGHLSGLESASSKRESGSSSRKHRSFAPIAARAAGLDLLSDLRAAGKSAHPFNWAGFVTWTR